jgi:hypothetical protein
MYVSTETRMYLADNTVDAQQTVRADVRAFPDFYILSVTIDTYDGDTRVGQSLNIVCPRIATLVHVADAIEDAFARYNGQMVVEAIA